jgi:MFS family permease
VAFLFSFALIGSVFWIAQMLQVGMGYSPLASGIRMLVFTMMPMIFAPLGGIGSDKIGTRPVMVSGLLLMGGGFLWLGLLMKADVRYASLVLPFIVAGVWPAPRTPIQRPGRRARRLKPPTDDTRREYPTPALPSAVTMNVRRVGQAA